MKPVTYFFILKQLFLSFCSPSYISIHFLRIIHFPHLPGAKRAFTSELMLKRFFCSFIMRDYFPVLFSRFNLIGMGIC